MKFAVSAAMLCAATIGLAGCGDTMRSYLEKDTPQQQAVVRPDLAMPPDLRLPEPGSGPETTASTEPGLYDNGAATSAAPATPAPPVAGAAPEGDIYARNGISLNHPDGTKKSDAELTAELKKVHLARKQQRNPNYGTVFNMGNIFKDE